MARIAGANVPDQKRLVVALTYIYGIGPSKALKIAQVTNVSPDKRVKELSDEEINKVRKEIETNYKIEGDLKREVLTHVKRLKEINTYRGSRHSKNLPVRGQRTKTNSRTVRGNVRKTAGSGKKTPAQKT